MPGHDIIVVGASAGGVEALAKLVSGLPADLPAALFIVHHFPPHSISVLPQILGRSGPLPAAHARSGEPIETGRIYVAPPNHHLLLVPGKIHLARGPRENGHRPAVDPLFRTAARTYGPRVVGVILTGTLDDGTAGLLAIKQRGGKAVVQDPDEALYDGMPRSAVENVDVDVVISLSEIAGVLARLAEEPVVGGRSPMSDEMEEEAKIAELDPEVLDSDDHPGSPSSFGCPECGGALWELRNQDLIRFRCRVGHAYGAESLIVHQTQSLETAMWTALRALEEKASLSRQMIDRARRRGNELMAARFELQVQETQRQAALIRQVLLHADVLEPVSSTGEAISTETGPATSGMSPADD
jgi:two-component system, chemotaxis family, protein-glutamate methylesterase/glutaminase